MAFVGDYFQLRIDTRCPCIECSRQQDGGIDQNKTQSRGQYPGFGLFVYKNKNIKCHIKFR